MQRHQLHCDNASLEFLSYGAHVLSWQCQGREQLFVSRNAEFKEGTAIRGGIPLIFPQFSTRGPLSRHGFARTQTWQLLNKAAQSAHLQLTDNAHTRSLWPHAFVADFFIELQSQQLSLRLQVRNCSDDVIDFTSALHSYFAVANIAQTQINGLQMCSYEDALTKKRRMSNDDVLRFASETDRIYQCNQTTILNGQHSLQLSSDGFDDTVIWNPHASGAAAIKDLADGEWQQFVCVEAANVMTKIVLPPDAEWSATHTITVV